MNRFLLRLYAIALICLSAMSCADDKFRMPDVSGDGEADIMVTATFKSYDPALDESRTEGNKLDGIDHLSVLVYDATGDNLIIRKDYGKDELSHSTNTDKPNDAVGPDITPTDKVSFKLPALRYGRYKIYVVANADLSGRDLSTETKLRAQRFEWSTTVGENAQMFGWFSNDKAPEINASGLVAPQVVINRPAMNINAWLVRLASKVTVTYDASGLNDGVTIYLKSVTIKDIPASCLLGERNTPTDKSQLIADGEVIKYYDGEDPTEASFTDSWPSRLTNKENTVFGNPDHSHEANALFFYENMQGTGKNKAQDENKDGEIDFPNPDENDPKNESGFKDNKPYGTYVEVEAYYICTSPDYPAADKRKGRIVYRFMLGKNITDNYDAERNYHYKLTLKFNKWANDYDWHIDYTPDPEIKLPNPYFISYLYDKSAVIPVEITGKINPSSKLKAEITENDWWPTSYQEDSEPDNPQFVDAKPDQYYNNTKKDFDFTNKVWNGFLSLRNTGGTTDISPGTMPGQANDKNESYWKEHKRGWRNYLVSEGTHTTDGVDDEANDGEYTVSYDETKGVTTFNIPYYTRAKNLVKSSGYTGNNPYVSYQRKAKVKFTANVWSPIQGKYVDFSKEVYIVQVRRVVNPKGIWRAHNEAGEFLVHLMRLTTEYTTNPYESQGEFESFKSIGPWTAEVAVGNDWIQLTPAGTSRLKGNNVIEGDNDEIMFNYKPNGTIGENEARGGIIKVRYHNYTCEHLIFVRQGYAPMAVKTGGTQWYTTNLVTATETAKSPCAEGSLFKRFRLDVPVRALNNISFPFMTKPGDLDTRYQVKPGDDGASIWVQPKKWTGWYTSADDKEFGKVTLTHMNGEKLATPVEAAVATIDDFLELYDDPDIHFGFGLLYDGSASGVQKKVKDAYSYYENEYLRKDYNVDAELGPKKMDNGNGMRGCFVYNEKTGAQIFLPIGAAGYGRRKQEKIYPGTFYTGMLIYANRNQFMQENDTDVPWQRPLLWDLYRRPGANYWANEMKTGYAIPTNSQSKNSVAWDFNYITFDFFPISSDNVMKDPLKTDALRIRCVVPSTSKGTKPGPDKLETK